MEQWKVDMVQSLGEGNRFADNLTKVRVGQPGEAVRMLVPLPEVCDRRFEG